MGFLRSLVAVAALLPASAICTAAPVETLRDDLRPLIKAAANSPVQFAVLVPHRVSARSNGQWASTGAGSAEWSYSVNVPTAVSLSFHATDIRLPPSAVMTVRGTATTVVYRALDIKKSDLWSRVLPGESLQLTIDVASLERDQVVLDIQSFQAGYRSLGAGTRDHPYYRKLLLRGAASDNSTCVQNYACSVTPANTPIAKATVALVVGNMYQCTGTLINNASGDNTPYVLTARHCQNGLYGGGEPGVAAQMTVYWNAMSSCGSTLGSIYDSAVVTQTGATTVFEQQDSWLVQLDDSPAYADAQFAGFDVSGVAVQGGYTIHHALGYNDQLTRWFGQALASQQSNVLGSSFVSDFLETVNQAGNIGPGASGSGLIDGNHHLVGTLSLGRKSDDPSGYESCPAPSPSAPTNSSSSADFTSLAGVWSSTADGTSHTGTVTLRSILDPSNSGVRVVPSAPAVNLNLAASSRSVSDGDKLVLSWDSGAATGCTASGGASGDGWSGALPATGSVTLTETFGGNVKYSLSCVVGGRRVSNALNVSWYGSIPYAFLETFGIRWVSANAILTWNSNVTPCSITGGGLSLSGLPSSGTTSTTQSSPGDVTYQISCGSGTAATTFSTTVSYITPALEFRATGTDRLLGQELYLYWSSYADTCIPSGGAPDDGWTSSTFGPQSFAGARVSTPGTYTYSLTCSAGPNSVTKSVTVEVENGAPYTALSITPTTVTYSDSPADYATIAWKSNLSDCSLTSNPVSLTAQYSTYPLMPSGAADAEDSQPFAPGGPGDYVVSMSCSGGIGPISPVSSAPVTLHVLPPPPPTVTLSTDVSSLSIGGHFTINWTSTNARNCTETGNGGGVGVIWIPGSGRDVSGSETQSVDHEGQVTLGITCQSIDPNQPPASAQVQITVDEAPSALLSIDFPSVRIGQPYTLSWSSANTTGCTASGGGASGSEWNGDVAISGSQTQTAAVLGTFTYTVTCIQRNLKVNSQATLSVAPAPAAAGNSPGKGGGGSLEIFDVLVLLGLFVRTSLAPSRQTGIR